MRGSTSTRHRKRGNDDDLWIAGSPGRWTAASADDATTTKRVPYVTATAQRAQTPDGRAACFYVGLPWRVWA